MDYKTFNKGCLEEAKRLYKTANADQRYVLEKLFPELRETEDEKIRKWIINEIKIKHHNLDEENVDFADKAISWLERQEGCEVIKKDWLEYIKQSWYKEGFIDGKYSGGTSKEWTINDAATLKELIDFLENKTVKLQHDLALYASWLKRKFYPSEKQGEQKSADSYCQENCKGFQETGKCFADGECKAKKEAKQKPVWKPSDEQIKVCKEVYADLLSAKGFDLGTVVSELNRLEEGLKRKENDMGLWLARDKSGELWVYDDKPQRCGNYYRNKDEDIRCFAEPIYESLYPEVTFENSPVELVPKMVDKSQTKYCCSYTTTTSVDNKNRR